MAWQLSPNARAASDARGPLRMDEGDPVQRDSSGSILNCAPHWTDRALKLAHSIARAFPWANDIGGQPADRCSELAHTGRLDLHASGRALDVMAPIGSRPGPEGEALANWLVIHADELGVQRVIWNRSIWQGNRSDSRRRFGAYHLLPGASPSPDNWHETHVHVEVRAGDPNYTPSPTYSPATTPPATPAPAAPTTQRLPGSSSDPNAGIEWFLLLVLLARAFKR